MLDGDPDLLEYVHRLLGYLSTGRTSEQIITIFHGPTATGKSTVLGAIMAALGDYAGAGHPEILLGNSGADLNSLVFLHDLQGKRLVRISEARATRRLEVEAVKRLTGGDPITCRTLNAAPVTFTPGFSFVLDCNHLPAFPGADAAVLRRLRVIPCGNPIPLDAIRQEHAAAIRGEAAGILAYLVRGAVAYLADGLGPVPEAVSSAVLAYRYENDPVGRFLEEATVATPGAWTSTADLCAAYGAWAVLRGLPILDSAAFGKSMRDRRIDHKRSSSCAGWMVRLTPQAAHGVQVAA